MTLRARVLFPSTGRNLPIVVIMHGFSDQVSNFISSTRERFAGYGVFALFVEMRGRGGSGGSQDAGGREIQDIIDAVQYVKANYATYVNPNQVYIVGYSGGGGNVFSALSKFPDTFNGGIAFFGISDYGYDETDGWYQNGADGGQQALLSSWIGGNPSQVSDAYYSRVSIPAVTNFTGGHLWMFHDEADSSVPVVNSQNVADALDLAGLTNYTLDISTAIDSTRWLHGYPNLGEQESLIEAEDLFIPPILAGTYPAWTVPESGTLQVAGYLDTKRFRLELGNLTDEYGEIVYNMTTRVFKITSDTGAATYSLTLKGQTPNTSISATINEVEDSQTSDADGNVTFTGSV